MGDGSDHRANRSECVHLQFQKERRGECNVGRNEPDPKKRKVYKRKIQWEPELVSAIEIVYKLEFFSLPEILTALRRAKRGPFSPQHRFMGRIRYMLERENIKIRNCKEASEAYRRRWGDVWPRWG